MYFPNRLEFEQKILTNSCFLENVRMIMALYMKRTVSRYRYDLSVAAPDNYLLTVNQCIKLG